MRGYPWLWGPTWLIVGLVPAFFGLPVMSRPGLLFAFVLGARRASLSNAELWRTTPQAARSRPERSRCSGGRAAPGHHTDWSESYEALQRSRSPMESLALMRRRQIYLDELERCDCDTFRAWRVRARRAHR